MVFSSLRIFIVALCSESRNGPVSNVWNPVVFLLIWIIQAASKKFTQKLLIVSLCDIIFMYDHRYYNAKHALRFRSSFKLFRNFPLLKFLHAYQSFLQHNSKVQSHRPMEQLGVPCVRRGEGFCYFDWDVFYFCQIELSWYSR